MTTFEWGGKNYDIDDLKLAVNNGDGTFGAVIDIPSVNLLRVRLNMKSKTGNGDGGISIVASAVESAEITFRGVSFSEAAYAAIMGLTAQSSGAGASQRSMLEFSAGEPNPSFGIAGRIYDAGSTTAGAIWFIPNIMITQQIQWEHQYNEFVSPEITGLAIIDPVLIRTDGRALLMRRPRYKTLPQISAFPIV